MILRTPYAPAVSFLTTIRPSPATRGTASRRWSSRSYGLSFTLVTFQPHPPGELLRDQVSHCVAAVNHDFDILRSAAQLAPHIGGPGAEVAGGSQHVDTPHLLGSLSLLILLLLVG